MLIANSENEPVTSPQLPQCSLLTASLKEKQKKSQQPVCSHHPIEFLLIFSSLSPFFSSFFSSSHQKKKQENTSLITEVTVKGLDQRKPRALCSVRPRERETGKNAGNTLHALCSHSLSPFYIFPSITTLTIEKQRKDRRGKNLHSIYSSQARKQSAVFFFLFLFHEMSLVDLWQCPRAKNP